MKIWKQKLEQMGASIEDRLSKKVTHVFAMNSDALLKKIGRERLSSFRGVSFFFFSSSSLYEHFFIYHVLFTRFCCIRVMGIAFLTSPGFFFSSFN